MKNHKLLKIENFINHPKNENKSIKNIAKILREICEYKSKIEFKVLGTVNCQICGQFFRNSNESKNFRCMHSVHSLCLKNEVLNISKFLDPSVLLNKIYCKYCGIIIHYKEIQSFFTKNELNNIEMASLKEIMINIQKNDRKLNENEASFNCSICITENNINKDCITLNCNHKFCKECLQNFLEVKIKDGEIQSTDIKCPEQKCNEPIEFSTLEYILSKEIIDKFIKFTLINLKGKNEEEMFLRCHTKDCENIFLITKNQQDTLHTCEACNVKFCIFCIDPHDGMTCNEYKKNLNEKKNDDLFFEMVDKTKIKQCWNCKNFVERNQGCNRLPCRCGQMFCYLCGNKWKTCGCPYSGPLI